MATKKEKREQAQAKHAAEMANLKASGLAAQAKDRKQRQEKELEDWRENHTKNHSWKKRITECPHCRIELAAQKHAARQEKKSSNSPVLSLTN